MTQLKLDRIYKNFARKPKDLINDYGDRTYYDFL